MCYFFRDAVGRSEVSGSKVSVFINEKFRDRGECGANEQNDKQPITPFDDATSASTPQYEWVFSHEQFGIQPFSPGNEASGLSPG